MVYFGTGKYLGKADDTQIDQDTQSFYGVWDRTESNGSQTVFTRSQLLEQEITAEVSVSRQSEFSGSSIDNTLRVTSDNQLTKWYDGQGSSSGEYGGWVLDLVDPDDGLNHGERVVTNARLRTDRVIFTTLIPNDNPCSFGGDSWLMELKMANGGRLEEAPFDLNEDTNYDSNDRTNSGTVPSGIKSKKGIYSEPAIVSTTSNELKLLSSSSGEVEAIEENSGDEDRGRQAWEELR
jgi:type IV pilus assembly protein PilY1